MLRRGARKYLRAFGVAVDQAARVAERRLPGRHARVLGHHPLEQRDHLRASALDDAVHDDRASVDRRGVGLTCLLSESERLFGQPLAGLQLAAHAHHPGGDEARVPSLRRLSCLLRDRLKHARAPRRPTQNRPVRSPYSAPVAWRRTRRADPRPARPARLARELAQTAWRACPAPRWRSSSFRAPSRASADRTPGGRARSPRRPAPGAGRGPVRTTAPWPAAPAAARGGPAVAGRRARAPARAPRPAPDRRRRTCSRTRGCSRAPRGRRGRRPPAPLRFPPPPAASRGRPARPSAAAPRRARSAPQTGQRSRPNQACRGRRRTALRPRSARGWRALAARPAASSRLLLPCRPIPWPAASAAPARPDARRNRRRRAARCASATRWCSRARRVPSQPLVQRVVDQRVLELEPPDHARSTRAAATRRPRLRARRAAGPR